MKYTIFSRSTIIAVAIVAACLFLANIAFCQDPDSSPPDRSTYVADASLPDAISVQIDSQMHADSIEASRLTMVPYRTEIVRWARHYYLPPSMLAAVCQIESKFQKWSGRTEDHYKRKAVVRSEARSHSNKSGGIPTATTEIDDRSRSYGLMQGMGQVYREQGYKGQYLAAMYDPDSNIKYGAIKLKALLKRYHGDTLSVASAYNQGNNRKINGNFENAHYVYKFNIAWKGYKRVFNDRKLLIGAAIDSAIPSYSVRDGANTWFWDAVRTQTAKELQSAIAYAQLAIDSQASSGAARYRDTDRYAQDHVSPYRGQGESDVDGIAVRTTDPEPEVSIFDYRYYILGTAFITIIAVVIYMSRYNDREQRLTSFSPRYNSSVPNGQQSFSGISSASRSEVRTSSPLHG